MNHRRWWYGAVLACLGDAMTTWYGTQVAGLTEKNTIIASLFVLIGVIPAILFAKISTLAMCVLCYTVLDKYKWIAPAIVAVLNGSVTALNLIQIAVVS